MAAVYVDGQRVMDGDRVRCIDGTQYEFIRGGMEYTVRSICGDTVSLLEGVSPYFYEAKFFELRHRKPSSPEPAPSSVGEWIEGAPKEPGDYWIKFSQSDKPHPYLNCRIIGERIYGPSIAWSLSDIEWHMPLPAPPSIPPPPPPVEKVIELPRLFRGIYRGAKVVGVEFEDGVRRFRATTGDHFTLDCSEEAEACRASHEKIHDLEFIEYGLSFTVKT